MTHSAQLRSGKGHRDENFPVASLLIRKRHRSIILAFYEFVRVADDIADHPTLSDSEKLAHLDRLEAALQGQRDDGPECARLRDLLCERALSMQHAQHLLQAFREDVTKRRYADWEELIEYCRYSAMPVGRFVLDVHGESQSIWPANDALCAALQIINHLQDCGADYRKLDRVYVPLDALAAAGVSIGALGEASASAALRQCLRGLVNRTAQLLDQSRGFAGMIRDAGLAMEVAAIHALAERLIGILRTRDPLSEPVHISKANMLIIAFRAAALSRARRLFGRPDLPYRPQARES